MKNNIEVDFIAGMSRSGTTLLLSILNTDKNNQCIPEIPIALYSYSSKKNKVKFTEKDTEIWMDLKDKLSFIRKIKVNESKIRSTINHIKNYREYLILIYKSVEFSDQKNNQTIKKIIDKDHSYTFQTKNVRI